MYLYCNINKKNNLLFPVEFKNDIKKLFFYLNDCRSLLGKTINYTQKESYHSALLFMI